MEEEITISVKEYGELKKSRKKLWALIEAGVDNWDGYDYAMESFRAELAVSGDDE